MTALSVSFRMYCRLTILDRDKNIGNPLKSTVEDKYKRGRQINVPYKNPVKY